MDVNVILSTLEKQSLLRTKRQTGDYMTVYCPFHNNGNERRPSCGVLLVDKVKGGNHYPKGFWHCFSCGYAEQMETAIGDILKAKNIHQSGLDWLKANIPDYEKDDEFEFLIPKDVMDSVTNQYALDYIKIATSEETHYISEEELARYRYTVPYMYERKLTDEIIEKFDVGFDPNFTLKPGGNKIPCITFPVHDEVGRTLFIFRRSIKTKLFNYPLDVLKPVYGLDMIPKNCSSLIICESIINALTLWTYGYVAVALLGTGTPYQINQLLQLGVREFIICMDGDDAGRRATARLYKQLMRVALVWRIDMPDGEDVNSIDKDKFLSLYEDRN